MNTHLRYISWNIKNKCEQFRYGGLLIRVEKQYLILAGKEGKTFSAQRFTINQDTNKLLHTTRFFKKLKKEELIQEELEETLDASKEIINILEQNIRPAVASDGGNIEFESYNSDTKLVRVILQGACAGCPSSTITLKNGIENMLKEILGDKISKVEAING